MQSNALAFYSSYTLLRGARGENTKNILSRTSCHGHLSRTKLGDNIDYSILFFFTFTVFEKKTDRCVCKALLSEEEISMEQIQHFFLHPFFIFFYICCKSANLAQPGWPLESSIEQIQYFFLHPFFISVFLYLLQKRRSSSA